MRYAIFLGLLPLALSATAQPMDHSAMPGMDMHAHPASPEATKKSSPDTKQKDAAPPKKADAAHMRHMPMPGMDMPPAMSPKTGMNMPDAPGHDMHGASRHVMPAMGEAVIPHGPPPPPPRDHAADRYFPSAEMAKARDRLQRDNGGASFSKVMLNLAEYQIKNGADGYRWEGQAWYGGDIDRFVLKSEGEATNGEGIESAEVQALFSRAVGVYTDVQAGIRQDFNPQNRTYATVGFESILPYWFDVEGAIFLSNKGELLGRLEGTYDLLITNRLILQPRAELNFAAQDTRDTRTGSGLSNAELGLRLRYEITREFAPYIGVSWDRQLGQTANYARAVGKSPEATSIVFGIHSFF